MRAAAALWVLLHHAVQAAGVPVPEAGLAYQMMINGFLGVHFFFVLSGFIIAMSCERLVADGRGVKDYVRARLTRIYVPYLPVGIAMLLLYTALPGVRANPADTAGIVTSLTLLPSNLAPALAVAWTLVHELIFYALFSLSFLGIRVLVSGLALWCAAIGAVWLLNIDLSVAGNYFLAPINLAFVFGAISYHATKAGVRRGLGPACLLTGTALVTLQAMDSSPGQLPATAGFVLILISAVSPEMGRLNPGRPLIILGAASYSVYLVHKPALAIMSRVFAASGFTPEPAWSVLALAVPALTAGLFYFYAYERRALSFARGL